MIRQRKSSLFLLEILIAIVLVGLFSVYFLRSSIHCLYRERNALVDLEFEKEYDLKRMDLITKHWHEVDKLPSKDTEVKEEIHQFSVNIGGKTYFKTKKFKVWCPKFFEKNYDLVLQEDGKKYHFLIKQPEDKI